MNIWNILLAAALILIVAAAIRACIRKRSRCGCGCEGCMTPCSKKSE